LQLPQVFSVGIPLSVGFRPQLVVVSSLSVGIPLMVEFMPQLVVVSGLSVGIPLTVGFRLSQSLRLSRSPFHELFFHTMEFRLSRSFSRIFLSHYVIPAITEPFTNFSFIRWNFGYQGAFFQTILSYNGISATESLSQTLTNSFSW
jgi:hypothetical protein